MIDLMPATIQQAGGEKGTWTTTVSTSTSIRSAIVAMNISKARDAAAIGYIVNVGTTVQNATIDSTTMSMASAKGMIFVQLHFKIKTLPVLASGQAYLNGR